VAGEPVVVTRDKAGTLRAFSNVCRYRAGTIAQGAGCKHVLNRAYHRWTYTLGGRLLGIPEIDGVEFFDRSTMGMVAFVVLALRTAATARTGFGEPSRSLPWGNGCCR
jgi:phenylpropionate dioxygenase-like ring-hydroxylating dioxygenase large terminal subunit